MNENDQNNARNELDTDDARTRAIGSQPTVPDKRLTNFKGQATQVPGISGVNLSYLPGDIVDKDYQLVKLLGHGGMGAVFSCKHLVLDREYAIKLLSAQQLTKEAWTRFQVEAQALARMQHPNIVSIYNMGIDKQQCPYYVMDLLAGLPLDAMIDRSGPLAPEITLDIFIQVAGALASAHNQGIIHRDIKPSNLMVSGDAAREKLAVQIVDFGIARVSKQDQKGQSQTATGLIFGTPYYMSPEQCQGERVDERSDVYSFGCAMYEALTGKPPFVGDSAFHTFMMHQSDEPPPMQGKADNPIPPALETAVQKMLRKKPDDRYQTMAQIEQDLRRIRQGKAIMAPVQAKSPKYIAHKSDTPTAVREEEEEEQATALEEPLLAIFKKLGLVLAALTLIAVPIVCYLVISNDKNHTKKRVAFAEGSFSLRPTQVLLDFGASDEELDDVTTTTLLPLEEARRHAVDLYRKYLRIPGWKESKFRTNGNFNFLPDVTIGSISIAEQKPVPAKGLVVAPAADDAFMYMMTPTREFPELLGKFGPDDLTGLAVVIDKPTRVLAQINAWKRLKELDFFNPLLKAMPNETEYWDESKISDSDLANIDKLTGIKRLGLCKSVSGPAILKMSMLNSLEGLNLKHINDFEPLLKELPNYDNLKEICLIHQDTKDDQLAYLAKMKNLQKLTIKRGYLTLGSLPYFQKMTSLKYLRLDRNDWSAQEKADFQSKLPNVKVSYEPVTESTYWQM